MQLIFNCMITHLLTHCCAWPAEGRSILHIERSWPAIQAALTDRPVSSSNCCSQFLRGRPGGCFQSAAGGVPVWASIDSCSACEAGVFSGRRQMWPNNEWRLSAIRDSLVVSFSHWLLRWIPYQPKSSGLHLKDVYCCVQDGGWCVWCSTILELSHPEMATGSGGVMFLHGLWRFCLMFFASAGIGVVFGIVSTMISLSWLLIMSHTQPFYDLVQLCYTVAH